MYIIYDCVKNNVFNVATKAIMKELDISFKEVNETFKYNGGYFGRICNLESFLYANVYNIAMAMKNDAILLATEEDSYANLAFTIESINSHKAIKDFVVSELKSNNIDIDVGELHKHIAYFPFILGEHTESIKNKVKINFGNSLKMSSIPVVLPRNTNNVNFSTCVFYGGRHFDCYTNDEYTKTMEIFDIVGLRYFETQESRQSFAHLENINLEKAYKKSGDILFSGIDLGVDFLCVFSDSTFNMFDKNQNLCTKYCGRDPIYTPILNMAQILLVSFDKTDQASFDLHNIKPSFIL